MSKRRREQPTVLEKLEYIIFYDKDFQGKSFSFKNPHVLNESLKLFKVFAILKRQAALNMLKVSKN